MAKEKGGKQMTTVFGYTLWGDAETREEAYRQAKKAKAEGYKGVMVQAIREFDKVGIKAKYWAIWVK